MNESSRDKLREIRQRKRMTQWDVRIKSGIHQSKLSLFENGYVELRTDEKSRLAKALGVPIREIWDE